MKECAAMKPGIEFNYGLSLDKFGGHQKIINWVGSGKRVLEIGCASGYMSREFTKRGCAVTGIEINPDLARKAKKYVGRTIVGDIENRSIREKLKGERFEVMVLADVLEHLKDPEGVLSSLQSFLAKDGKMIISVPNIAFLTNRLLLFLGRFDYSDWGIMDKTHLRFFTKESILELVKNAGLVVEKIDPIVNFTQLPLYMQTLYPVLGKRDWWRKIEYKIGSFWPNGLAVQFVILCRRVP